MSVWSQVNHESCCIVFDTETNGLFRPNKKTNPRMVALAWSLFTIGSGSFLRRSYIVRADDFDPNPSGLLMHRIDREKALREGIPVKQILSEFKFDCAVFRPQLLVAHNIEFDIKVLYSECERIGFDLSRELDLPKFCTMKETTSMLAIPRGDLNGEYERRIAAYKRDHNMRTKRARRGLAYYEEVLSKEIGGKKKWPNLQELSQHLFGAPSANWHDALADVECCERCFRKLAEQKIAEHSVRMHQEETRRILRERERLERKEREVAMQREREKRKAAERTEYLRRQEVVRSVKRTLALIFFGIPLSLIALVILLALLRAVFRW